MASSVLSSGFTGRTGGMYAGLAGRILPMPGSGDGVTLWVGGSLRVPGVPPGTQAQLIGWQKWRGGNVILAESIFGFDGVAQFFRPPDCDFPVGRAPGLHLRISHHSVTGLVEYPARPLPLSPSRTQAFPLFINSQNWSPQQYGPNSMINNTMFTDTQLNAGVCSICKKIGATHPYCHQPCVK
jgi:hypothetical protein